MEKVNPEKQLQQAQQRANSSKTQTGDARIVINKLFATIKVAYPSFLNGGQDAASAKRMWAAHLTEYSDELVEKAARLMVDRYPTFAPTIGEFKKLMKELNTAQPAHRDYKALPAPKAAADVAERELAKMRDMLR